MEQSEIGKLKAEHDQFKQLWGEYCDCLQTLCMGKLYEPCRPVSHSWPGRKHVECIVEGVDFLLAERTAAAAKIVEIEGERNKLAAFKAYVHKRLDDAGVPVDPESSHKAEGCRIGGRLDIVLNRPEPWAYEQVCKTSEAKRLRIAELENALIEAEDGTGVGE